MNTPNERAIWLRREGDYFIVAVEENKQWVDVIREHASGPASHIVEPLGIKTKVLRAIAERH